MTKSNVELRQWEDRDLPLFAEMNANPEVMRYFPRPLTIDESASMMSRLRESIDKHGWGLWAVEVDGEFAGFTGLSEPSFHAHFTPCVEIGWRFLPSYWGRGLAHAAAQMAQQYAFHTLGLEELVSFTTEKNARSRKLMERLGFNHDPQEDFWHPNIEEGHPLRRHVLYRKKNEPRRGSPRR